MTEPDPVAAESAPLDVGPCPPEQARRARQTLGEQLAARKSERAAGRGAGPRTVPEAVPGAAPAAVAVSGRSSVPERAVRVQTEPEPDAPWEPLPPGAFDSYLRDAGVLSAVDPDREQAQRLADAQAMARADAADEGLPVRERALRMLARRLGVLGRIADGGGATVTEQIAAVREICKIADVYESASHGAQHTRQPIQIAFVVQGGASVAVAGNRGGGGCEIVPGPLTVTRE